MEVYTINLYWRVNGLGGKRKCTFWWKIKTLLLTYHLKWYRWHFIRCHVVARRIHVKESNERGDDDDDRVSKCADQPHGSVDDSLNFIPFAIVFGAHVDQS